MTNTYLNRLIRQKRDELYESQTTFGKRFGKSHATVSGWELGYNQAPYQVIEFVLEGIITQPKKLEFKPCPRCAGKGQVLKRDWRVNY